MRPLPPRQRALRFLKDQSVMSLATHGPEGLWAAAVFYANVEFTLYFLSSPTSRHSLNIEANPFVSVAIQEDHCDWREIRGIQLEGKATRIEGLEQSAALTCYGLKFPVVGNLAQAPMEVVRAFGRIVWYKVVPVRIYFIDNSLGLGHREELAL